MSDSGNPDHHSDQSDHSDDQLSQYQTGQELDQETSHEQPDHKPDDDSQRQPDHQTEHQPDQESDHPIDQETQHQSDHQPEQKEPPVTGEIIRDLFNESESEDEEFEGFKKPDTNELSNDASKIDSDLSSHDEEETNRSDIVYDFDLMMERKKEQNRRRKRKNYDIINDSDDLIADMIQQMR